MNKLFSLLFIVLLASCGPRRPGKLGEAGKDGVNAISVGVDLADITPGAICASGGLLVSTFKDANSDGILDPEELVLKVKTVCNGVQGNAGNDGDDGSDGNNGTNGQNGTNSTVSIETLTPGVDCPTGGAKISSNSSPTSATVCNGTNGSNGLNGLNGLAGINGQNGANGSNGVDGINGTNGSSVVPVKFCTSDNSAFPEYGLVIGSDVFAVYWGTTPASPSAKQAFLAKLTPGSYQSTGGNNCQFTLH